VPQRRARVHVTLRRGVLDPQGAAIAKGLSRLGFSGVGDVRVGKVIELTVERDGPVETLRRDIEEMCRRLLANPVIEDFTVEVDEP
jgi:phosphoribosylformylglycinamidine synthase